MFSRKAIIFLALTFLFDWLLALAYYLMGGRLSSPNALIVLLVFMFGPMLMGIVTQKIIFHEPLRAPLGISFRINRWFFVAWFLPPLIAFVTLGVSLLIPDIEFSPGMEGMFERYGKSLTPAQLELMRQQTAALPIHPFWIGLLSGLVAGITINSVAAFGEELGWRGLLQKEFSGLGFWKSSIIIGIIWGIWHAPIIIQGYNYPEHPVAGVFMMTIFTLLFAPLIGYIRKKSQSVIAAAIMHGSLNGTWGLAILLVKGGDDLTIGITGLAGFIALIVANCMLFAFIRRFDYAFTGG